MQSVYIAGASSGSGKSVVVLGFMEMLYAVNRRVGFFRPIVAKSVEQDDLSALVLSRYNLPFSQEMLYGCTAETARHLIAAGRYDDLLKLILNKFKALEETCDLVVCAGTDFDGLVPSLEFDFNADLANNLGCTSWWWSRDIAAASRRPWTRCIWPMSPCGTGAGTCWRRVVNRVPAGVSGSAPARARAALPEPRPSMSSRSSQALGMPTVGEIRKQLGAECMCGDGDGLNQVVTNYKVAAMEIPDFLNYIEDGCLIITPGDRADIILASLMADVSTSYPRVAGSAADRRPAARP